MRTQSVSPRSRLRSSSICSAFTFNATTGAPTGLVLPVKNAASIKAQGLDFALSYRSDLARFFAKAPGALNLAFSGTYTRHVFVDLGTGTVVDRAGENSQLNSYAIPRFRMNLAATYLIGPASVTSQVIFVSKGTIDNTFNTTAATTINTNDVPAAAYVNLLGSVDLTRDRRLQLFASINNLFDKDPPPVPSTTLFTPTNGSYYDTVGRAFQLGFTFKY